MQHHPYWRPYYEAALSGRLQPLVAALVGTHGVDAVLSGRLRPLVAALVGEQKIDGQLAAALRPLRFAGTNIITSDLGGRLQPLRASMAGDQAFVGTLGGSLQPLRAALSGEQIVTGQLAGGLQPLRASLAGSQAHIGQLGAQLRPITAALSGTQSQTGVLAATLRALLFSGLGTHSQSGVLAGGLSPLTASMAGSVRNAVVFDNSSDGGSGGTTTRSWNHDNQGNCIVVGFTNSTTTAPTCTYGGVTIPRVFGPTNSGTVFPYNGYCSVFALISNSLPQGVNTVSCTQAGTASAAGAVSFKNAGSFATLITDTANGAINKTTVAGDGRAAVAAYGGGGISFGAISPNEAMRYGFTAFVTWPTVIGWGLDTGSGITFSASQASSKAGAIVTILPP
ncbi:hypothetical protein A5717_25935 [Mycolicibacterium porcinum]|uniref:hypothetical protein n=1 Tax=Mycolicibacterium porcinum TaxID=39693 RepID=UPI00080B48C5|nr:hypothetical protein [Mycolicibacterium porcinum]OCB09218.1 hypothetical protein A5717_25935 [Mycolicibacterium porcinum]